MESSAKATKQESLRLLGSLGLKGTVMVDRGGIPSTIVKHGAKQGVALLSIGSRGLDALDRFMLGSAYTNYAIHHAPCLVLAVKGGAETGGAHSVGGRRLTGIRQGRQIFVSPCESSAEGPDHAPVLVTVVHVMPFLKYPEVREAGRAVVQRYVEKVAKVGFQVQEAVRLGKPADEILTVAQRQKADLIITGAKGLGAIGRVLLGSVSTRVVQHAPCSVPGRAIARRR